MSLRLVVIMFGFFGAHLVGCGDPSAEGPSEMRQVADGGVDDGESTEPEASGLECAVDDDCEEAERCKHFGTVSICVLGCGSDDDCPEAQSCELYGAGDGICVKRCRLDAMCGDGQICESRGPNAGACVPEPVEVNVSQGGTTQWTTPPE